MDRTQQLKAMVELNREKIFSAERYIFKDS